MATLQRKGNGWYCQFLHHGKRHTLAIGRVSEGEARAKADQVGYLMMRLKQGLLELPAGVDIREFVQRDGKPRQRPDSPRSPSHITLAEFRDRYLTANRSSLEGSSIRGIVMHFKHLVGVLGNGYLIAELKLR